MPDSQKKRGKHPKDLESFGPDQVPILQEASRDLAWLKSRDYSDPSALKLVGDRYRLNARQRTAVARSTCSDTEVSSRRERMLAHADIAGRIVHIDGFNLLTTVEAYFGDGILLVGRDGCLRDMSSMHGNYRVLDDTDEAIDLIHGFICQFHPAKIRWLLDKPVSNSGRLRAKIEDLGGRIEGLTVEVELVPDPDPVLIELPSSGEDVIITADSGILNRCGFWVNITREMIESCATSETGIVVDFSGG